MAFQTLAKINDNRSLTHEAGQTVYMRWDDHTFNFTRDEFMCFADVLYRGNHTMYAACEGFSSVDVDEEQREVWIQGTCLTLNHADYRILMNAALRTKTRLYGFRADPLPTPIDHITFHTVGSIRPPKPMRFCNN